MPMPIRGATPIGPSWQHDRSTLQSAAHQRSCDEHLRELVEDRAEEVAEEHVGADEAALRGEIGGVHQLFGGDVDIDRDEVADREKPDALSLGVGAAGAFLAAEP